MPYTRPRLLTAAAATATLTAGLTAGGLGAAPAQAAGTTTSATYSCSGQLLGGLLPIPIDFDLPMQFDVTDLPSVLTAGVPTDGATVSATTTVGAGLLDKLFTTLGGTLQATTSTVLAPAGADSVGLQLQSAVTTVGAGTRSLVLGLSGAIPAFTPDQVGSYDIPLPTTVDLTLTGGLLSALGNGVLPCTLERDAGTPTTLGSYTVRKGPSSLSARTTKVKKGKKPKVVVAVSVTTGSVATIGSVTASEAGRTLASQTLYGGSATFAFKGLAKGVHTVRFAYSGSSFSTPSEQTVTFKMPKAKKAKAKHKQKHHRKHQQKHQHRKGKHHR